MTAVVDYGVGNLCSLLGSLAGIGEDAVVTGDSRTLLSADRIILPGVGAFGDAMGQLESRNLTETLKQAAVSGIPFLGICLGMQLLFEESREFGIHRGLGLISGTVVPIRERLNTPLKVPHMGWNALQIKRKSPLLADTAEGTYVYYVHSFCAVGCEDNTDAVSDYGCEIVGAVSRNNVFGTQFHPEKSGKAGLSMLRAFCRLKKQEVLV